MVLAVKWVAEAARTARVGSGGGTAVVSGERGAAAAAAAAAAAGAAAAAAAGAGAGVGGVGAGGGTGIVIVIDGDLQPSFAPSAIRPAYSCTLLWPPLRALLSLHL